MPHPPPTPPPPAPPPSPPLLQPSASEVESVVLRAARSGDWMRAASLLSGAIRLRCVPTPRTYAAAMSATATRGGWAAAVRLCDALQTSALSTRALLHTAADAVLCSARDNYSVNEIHSAEEICSLGAVGSSVAALSAAARARGVMLAMRHHVVGCELLRRAGDWRSAIAICRGPYRSPPHYGTPKAPQTPQTPQTLQTPQTPQTPQSPQTLQTPPAIIPSVIVPPLLRAAAEGRQWAVAAMALSAAVSAGIVPSPAEVADFVRAFTPDAPFAVALAVADALPSRAATDAADALRAAVRSHSPVCVPLSPAAARWDWPTAQPWRALWAELSADLSEAPADEAVAGAAAFARWWAKRRGAKGAARSIKNSADGEDSEESAEASAVVSAFVAARVMRADGDVVDVFIRDACDCGWWREALAVTRAPAKVFAALTCHRHLGSAWDSAAAVFAAMAPSARERHALRLEESFIASGHWAAALRHAAQCPLAIRRTVIPLCAALGMWRRTLTLLRTHVPQPSQTEQRLIARCAAAHTSESVHRAAVAGDWQRALRTCAAFAKIRHRQSHGHREAVPLRRTSHTDMEARERETETETETGAMHIAEDEAMCLPADVVECAGRLLLRAGRYDECCALLRSLAPRDRPSHSGETHRQCADTAVESAGLRALRLFLAVRSSPLLYGRALQRCRDAARGEGPSARAAIDAHAALALQVGGNSAGAFAVLRGMEPAQMPLALRAVPRLADCISPALRAAPDAAECGALLAALVPCVAPGGVRVGDVAGAIVYLSSRCSNSAAAVAAVAAAALLRQLHTVGLPAPLAVLRIAASRADAPWWTIYTLLLRGRHSKSSNSNNSNSNSNSNKKENAKNAKNEKDSEEEEAEEGHRTALLRQCVQGFAAAGHWAHVLHALRHDAAAPADALLRAALHMRADTARAERAAAQVRGSDSRAILALAELRAWRAALDVFFAPRGPFAEASVSAAATAAVLSCAAVAAPWDVALRLLATVVTDGPLNSFIQNNSSIENSSVLDSAVADVLHAVRRGAGPVACSRALLRIAECTGAAPGAAQCDAVLRAVRGTRVSAAEREQCGEYIARLGRTLSEQRVVELVAAIARSARAETDPHDNDDNDEDPRDHQLARAPRKARACVSAEVGDTTAASASVERPTLSAEEVRELCLIAPRIVIATARGLEVLSETHFSGRFRPFELCLLLHDYRPEILRHSNTSNVTTNNHHHHHHHDENNENGDNTNNNNTNNNNNNSNNDDDSGEAELLAHCRDSTTLPLLLLPFAHRMRVSPSAALRDVRRLVFDSVVPERVVARVWDTCRPRVEALAANRMPALCEHELLRAVQRRGGRPPRSLMTQPRAGPRDVSAYWSAYGRAVWPGLFLSAAELCRLAAYMPLLDKLRPNKGNSGNRGNRGNRGNSGGGGKWRREALLRDIHAAHFAADAIPKREAAMRRPRDTAALRAVLRRAAKTLRRLHAQLDVDARGGRRYYYHCEADPAVWRRHETKNETKESETETEGENGLGLGSRWALALRILRQRRRAVGAAPLPPNAIAALFAACAADCAERNRDFRGIGTSGAGAGTGTGTGTGAAGTGAWWALALRCAVAVEPAMTHDTWRHAMHLAQSTLDQEAREEEEEEEEEDNDNDNDDNDDVGAHGEDDAGVYRLEDIRDPVMQATTRALLLHVRESNNNNNNNSLSNGSRSCNANKQVVPFEVSLLLVDRMKELLRCAPSGDFANMEDADDALTVWALLTRHECWEKMNPLHVTLLRRLVQE